MKRHIAFLLILCSFFSLLCNASAAEALDSTEAESRVVLTSAAPAVFSVTVPSSLPVALKADGAAEVATNAKIINNGYAPVEVTAIAVNDATGWTKVAFSNATTFKTYKVDSKQYAMKIGTESKLQDASTGLSTDGGIIGTCIDGGTDLPFSYDGLISSFSAAQNNQTVATVVFTVSWVEAA